MCMYKRKYIKNKTTITDKRLLFYLPVIISRLSGSQIGNHLVLAIISAIRKHGYIVLIH